MQKNISLALLLIVFSPLAQADVLCTANMMGARLDGSGFWRSYITFSSRQMCEHAVRNSANGLICLNNGDFFYSLYSVRYGEKLDSQYMGFKECVSALRKARKGLVCASAVKRGTNKLIDISTHQFKSFSTNEECQEYLDSL